ncbi:hypothetical protein N7457_007847 [Penicillium paradoxum]|uniref:uncharacterized protein n=1 Tax=Penicillium paradoxum TaxID=176176 RepID=UPI0025491A7C|nr:uncharacterized protein N7457_007847 [Penicillium paradoxum]KAJ5772951.1 hypothetical protein N7457_007847 [Penicillium paradoxum]
MQYTFAAVSLLAGLVSATTITSAATATSTSTSSAVASSSVIASSSKIVSSSATPSSLSIRPSRTPKSSSVAATSSFIASSTSVAVASGTPGVKAADTFDCVYAGWACDWIAPEHSSGSDYCGRSPFKAGHELPSGSKVLAVSMDGADECASKAGEKCCQVLADAPCRRGEKYLECKKLE